MKLTSSEFAGSFYYAGSGTDLQPLLRFSNLASTFVYVCIGEDINPSVVERSFRSKLDRLEYEYPRALKLEGVTGGLKLDDFEYEMPGDWRGFMSANEFRDYCGAFGPYRSDDNWAMEFRFTRQFGATTRPLRLIYLNGEAVASYCALSRNGKVAPQIFCAIQTGILERANGMMNRIFLAHQSKPRLWVRGCWHDQGWGNEHTSGAFDQVGCFPIRTQGFRAWNSRIGSTVIPTGCGGENPWSERSTVAAFAQSPPTLQAEVQIGSGKRSVLLANRHLGTRDIKQFDAVFAPQHVILTQPELFGHDHVIPTDLVKRMEVPAARRIGPAATLPETLEQVDEFARNRPGCEIGLVGTGFEDEAACFADWSKAEGTPCRLSVFAPEPLDYADLRGWPAVINRDSNS